MCPIASNQLEEILSKDQQAKDQEESSCQVF
jgi:hypothetical protein